MHTTPSTESHTGRIVRGVAYGAGAGALWGLVFLAPVLLPAFNGLDMAVGRYLAYGLISLVLIRPRLRAIRGRLHRTDWLTLAGLALLGNTLYYVLLTTAVQTAGIALTTLIIGFLPVAVTVIGSRDHDAVPLVRLAPSLWLCAAGIACIGGQGVLGLANTAKGWLGMACAVGALASWTAFAVWNSRCLKRLDHISSDDWNLLTGLVTGAQALLLSPALLFDHTRHTAIAWSQLAALSIAVALVASIAGNALWNRMSRLLPLTLAGQMILFETVFALLYGFIWEHRFPTLLETAAFACVVAGVTTCVAAHRPPKPQKSQ